MKKLLAFTLCIMLMFAMSIPAFAEETTTVVEETTVAVEETTPVEDTEPEASEPAPETDTPLFEGELTTDVIVDWITKQFEEISVIITLIVTLFYQVKKHSSLNKSIGIINNNAITVATNSEEAIKAALTQVQNASSAVENYKEQIGALLEEVRYNAEEKARLEAIVTEISTHFKTAKLANVELANEVAELLILANIPNSKKDELYSRHLAAVAALADAERTEVKEDEEETE